MNVKNLAKLSLILAATTLLASCAEVKIRETRFCSVAGVLIAGMDCGYDLSDKTDSMTFDEMVEFLEPQPERPDPKDPNKMLPARAGAMCQPADDWNHKKTVLEQACKMLGKRCSWQLKEMIRKAGDRAKRVQDLSLQKMYSTK